MANTLLTADMITREALRILHQKAVFLGSINRAYDDSFAKNGAKIGDALRIRLPNQYTVRTGAIISTQDTAESQVTLTVATQKGVDVNFGMAELAMKLDDFTERILDPAMAALAANIESDALSMYKDVYNIVDGDAVAFDFVHLSTAKEELDNNLTPPSQRTALLSNKHINKFLVATKGLFNPQRQLGKQFSAGMVVGNVCDLDVGSSSHIGNHTTGTAAKTTGYLSNGATQTGATINVDTGTTTFLKGDIITFAGMNRVHPETKVSSGLLQRFVITADSGASATSLAISPSIVATGAKQNVSNSVADNSAIVKVGAGASELLDQSLAYNKDAFTFATADLPDVSQFGAWGARKVQDSISMRIARQYDITNDKLPTRIDVLYGFKTIRPELACRIHADG